VKKYWIIAVGILIVIGALFFVFKMKSGAASKKEVALASEPVVAKGNYETLLKSAIALQEQGDLLKARDLLKNLMAVYAARGGIEDIQKRLEDVNMKIIFSGVSIPNETAVREVKEGDSLSMIADEYRTTTDLIKRENGLSSNVIRPGQRLRIWTGRFSIVVNKSQNLLFLKSNGEIVKTYRVSTGKDNITPVGTFKIINKLVDPSWTHNGKLIPSNSPENILGTRWLGFDIPSYGIHGTTQPESIGKQATAGCVRMLNKEVEELYSILPVNTEVTIMD
jgi:lipoprotein-anchoring transpeptidase ErfK/SrfK